MNQHRGGVTAQIGKRKERDDPTSSLSSLFLNNSNATTPTNRNKTNSHVVVVRGKTGKPSTTILNDTTPLSPTWKQQNNNNKKNNKNLNLPAVRVPVPVPVFSSSSPSKTSCSGGFPAVPVPVFSPSSPSKTSSSGGFLLAGYMAHEFLTKGTLLGRKYDAARAGSGILPLSPGTVEVEPKKMKPPPPPAVANRNGVAVEVKKTYAEMASLMKGDGGVHIPGIVNPTQLARWIQM